MTIWRIVEGTNDKGHPLVCTWELLFVSEYDIILNPEFLKENPFERVKISISEKRPNKPPYFRNQEKC